MPHRWEVVSVILKVDSKSQIPTKHKETYSGQIHVFVATYYGHMIDLGSQRTEIWGKTSTEKVRGLLSSSVAYHAHLAHL